jgi:hypothetical protein
MIGPMALTPGGGRSPSTKTPPAPPSNGSQRPSPDQRARKTPRLSVLLVAVVRWGVLIGGLVIIADLATKAMTQGSVSADDASAIAAADQLANWVLYSILGIAIVRQTGVIYSGALAGLLAAVLDAILVAAVNWLTPPVPSLPEIQALFISNVVTGTLFSGVSGIVYGTVQRLSGGRRLR